MTTSGRLCGPVALCRKERQREGPTCRATRAPRNLSLYTQNSKPKRQKLPNPPSDSVGFPSSGERKKILEVIFFFSRQTNPQNNSQKQGQHDVSKYLPLSPPLHSSRCLMCYHTFAINYKLAADILWKDRNNLRLKAP